MVDEYKAISVKAKVSNKMEMIFKKEQKTQAYRKKMSIDIENINTF